MNQISVHKFENILSTLTEIEQYDLISYLASKLKGKTKSRRPLALAGFLSDKVVANFDIEAVLDEARHQWLAKWNGEKDE